MTRRATKGRGLFYTRDSQGRSDIAPEQYVDWAKRRADELGVEFFGASEVTVHGG